MDSRSCVSHHWIRHLSRNHGTFQTWTTPRWVRSIVGSDCWIGLMDDWCCYYITLFRNPSIYIIIYFSRILTHSLDLLLWFIFYHEHWSHLVLLTHLLSLGRIIDVHYEALVHPNTSKIVLQNIITNPKILNLPWDPAVMEFNQHHRPVHTASVSQISTYIHSWLHVNLSHIVMKPI